jgi:hypothetical protein
MNKMLKNVLGSVVEFEDKPAVKKPEGHSMISPTAPVSGPALQTTAPVTKEQADKFQVHFYDLMKKANLPGPDYFELSKIDETLKIHIPDEKTRMIAAFASLQAQSTITKKVIVTSAQTYIEVIQKDKEGFQKALGDKQAAEVDARKKQIEDLNQSILAAKQKIDELNASIVQSTTSIQKLNSEVSDIETSLQQNEQAYLNACDGIISKITSDIEKVNSNL